MTLIGTSCCEGKITAEARGHTTTTDSRSQRSRANRRGSQITTRARSSLSIAACPQDMLPSPLSRYANDTPLLRRSACPEKARGPSMPGNNCVETPNPAVAQWAHNWLFCGSACRPARGGRHEPGAVGQAQRARSVGVPARRARAASQPPEQPHRRTPAAPLAERPPPDRRQLRSSAPRRHHVAGDGRTLTEKTSGVASGRA